MVLAPRSLVRLRRSAAGYGGDGVFVAGSATESPFVGAMQPANRRRVEHLSEGDRLRDPRVVLCDDPAFLAAGGLRTADPVAGVAADEVRDPVSGFVYTVQDVASGTLIPHVDALVLRRRE